MQYYSQWGQDQYLWENFFSKMDRKGVFVDIGAHDGISGSNTKFFEDQGWHGICFEPIPDVYWKLYENRKCLLNNCAISDNNGWAPFTVIKGHSEMLSGLQDCYSSDHLQRITREVQEHNQEVEVIEVRTLTFNLALGLLANYDHIDYLSIDTEGSEDKIIRSIDFHEFQIYFMTVEFNPGSPHDLHNYILSQGFEHLTDLGYDRVYKRK